jgi:uncharacterized protein YaiE (UPF0345 family)
MATINHKTYNEATETFKDFNVYDGKETLIFKVDGSEGNVGIGTSSPATALHIANASNAVVRAEGTATNGESTFQLLGKNSSGTARSAIFKYDNSDLIRIGVTQAIDMRFETNDTERMRITSGGNVQLLGNKYLYANPSAGSTTIGSGFNLDGSNNLMSLWTNDTERMRITSTGNVGIGTSTANTLLSIDGAADNGLSIQGIGTTSTRAFFGLDTSGDGYLSLTNGSSFAKNVQLSSDLSVSNYILGNVGIGTTSPSVKTEISGSASGDFAALALTNTNQAGTADAATLNFKLGRSVDSFLFTVPAIKFVKEQQWTSSGSTVDGALAFSTIANESTSEKMRITSAGSVGIGVSDPNGTLTVKDPGTNTRLEFATEATGVSILGFDRNTTLYKEVYLRGSTIKFNPNDVNRVTVTSDGLTFNGDTAAANALDDYEEGTWTPVLRGSSTAGIYEISDPYAVYTKIGRQVTAGLQFTLSSSITGGGSGYAVIEGLPFNKRANAQFQGICTFEGVAYSGDIVTMEFVSPSSATALIYFRQSTSDASGSDLNISAFSANDQVKMTITYFV